MNHLSEQPLTGRTIVITRAASQSADFISALESYGATVIACPTIEITDPLSFDQLDETIDHLYGYDWIIFTSANGVEYFVRRLQHANKSVADLDDLKVCAIGQATADKLHDAKVHVDLIPSESKAEGVYSALMEFVGGAERLQGLNVLVPRAAVGRDYLPNALQNAGARVDVVTAYRTVVPDDLDRGRLSAMLAGSADCVAFTSSSTVRNLALLFDTNDLGKVFSGIAVACIGSVTAETVGEFGLRVDIQPGTSTVAALAQAIAHFYVR